MDNNESKQCYMFQLATAYVPYQEYGRLYPLDEALKKGTLFHELYRPYFEEGKR